MFPRCGESAGEGHGVSFRYAYVERPLRIFLIHLSERGARYHGRRDAHHVLIGVGQLHESVAEDILPERRRVGRFLLQFLPGVGVELAGGMPGLGIVLGLWESLPLDGAQMEQARPLHILYLSEHLHELHHVMSVERPEIAYVEALEYVLAARHESLYAVVEAHYQPLAVVVENSLAAEEIGHPVSPAVVALGGGEVGEVSVERTHVVVNAHVVVVEHDQQVVGVVGCVV